MNILFLGDIVGNSGCNAVKKFLPNIIKSKKINFVVVNGENAAREGVGITENNVNELLSCGVDVITTGNHVWDQKETLEYIKKQKRLLRPLNLSNDIPGNGFGIYNSMSGYKVGVLNLMGNIFMKKCDDVFVKSKEFLDQNSLKDKYDFLIVDFHGEITSEKMAIGNVFDGKATFVVGTHTHVPTNDGRVLNKGTAYLTDAGMCGDYNSVIGMNLENSINRFYKRDSTRHFPAEGEASLCGAIIEANPKNGLASKISQFIFGGQLQKDKKIMAGHSHWAGIKHKKGKADKQRSTIFSKLSREITVAAKLGDKNPDMNSRLRSAIQAARSANMPKDNIERAIDKSSIAADSNFENIRYEGFGPAKTAIVVITLTDNKNRTASNIRTIFQKYGGGLGTQGSASHNFVQQGIIKINKQEIGEETIFDLATDAGANDCKFLENYYEIHTNKEEIYDVKSHMEKEISNFISTEIEWVPINTIKLNEEEKEQMIKFIEILEEDDDVQNIFTNAI